MPEYTSILVRHFRFFVLFNFYFLAGVLLAQDTDEYEFDDVTHRLLDVSQPDQLKLYDPSSPKQLLGLFLEAKDSFEELEIVSTGPLTLWKDGKLLHYQITNSVCQYKELFDMNQTQIYLTLQFSNTQGDISLRFKRKQTSTISIQEDKIREMGNIENNFFFAALCFSLFVLMLYRIFLPSRYFYIFNWLSKEIQRAFGNRIATSFTIVQLLDTVLLSLFAGFIALLISKPLSSFYSTQEIVFEWIRFISIGFAFLLSKLFFVLIFNSLYKPKWSFSQVADDFNRFFIRFAVLIFFIVQLIFWIEPQWVFLYSSFLVGTCTTIYLGYIFFISVKIASNTHFEKLHIFTYLCATEFIWAYALAWLVMK